jgi:hypothetical protein
MEPGEKYWSVLDPIWDTIEIDTAKDFDRTLRTVPRQVGLLYAAHFCQSEVCNGGFTQFFFNSTGVLAPEAAEGFREIGQPRVAVVVQRAIEMLGSPFNRDRAARWSDLARLGGNPTDQGSAANGPPSRNMALFRPLEDEFYSLLASEAGGVRECRGLLRRQNCRDRLRR